MVESISTLPETSFTPEEEAKLVRRIDFRLLPMLFLIYVVAFLDRYGFRSKAQLKSADPKNCVFAEPMFRTLSR